jgi:lipoprotein signal peptidase
VSGFWIWIWIVTQVVWDVTVVVWIRSQMSMMRSQVSINKHTLEWMRLHDSGARGEPSPTSEGGV